MSFYICIGKYGGCYFAYYNNLKMIKITLGWISIGIGLCDLESQAEKLLKLSKGEIS